MSTERGLGRYPAIAVWEVTRACGLCCLHCRTAPAPRGDRRELTTAEAYDLLAQLAELDPGLVVLTGDFSKRPDLHDLIVEAVRLGLRITVAASVTPLLTPGALERLATLGVSRIALDLDGPDAATHDHFRGTSGSFAATRATIVAARAAGLPLAINTTLTRQTVAAIPRTAELVGELGAEIWNVFFVVPVGRARPDQQLGPDACERVFSFLYEWSARAGQAVETTAAPAYRRVVRQREAAGREPWRPHRPGPSAVNDGKGYLFISHTGDIYPSDFLPLTTANVRDARLADVYRKSRLFRALRDEWRLEGKCGICPFRSLCGGSRARAYAVTGNFLAEDPACAYQPPPRMA